MAIIWRWHVASAKRQQIARRKRISHEYAEQLIYEERLPPHKTNNISLEEMTINQVASKLSINLLLIITALECIYTCTRTSRLRFRRNPFIVDTAVDDHRLGTQIVERNAQLGQLLICQTGGKLSASTLCVFCRSRSPRSPPFGFGKKCRTIKRRNSNATH